jgi:beta-N-acetylhexosaminidase
VRWIFIVNITEFCHRWYSHLDLPVDERPLSDISQDMQVFKDLINHGLDAVMPAHVVYSQVDSSPAGFSSKWIKILLVLFTHSKSLIFSKCWE